MTITKPGVYDIPAADYHADRLCAVPSLSSGLVKKLIDLSPAHARIAHPRLNPKFERKQKRQFDLGSACHEVILGDQNKRIQLIDPERHPSKTGIIPQGYTNDAIREARDSAYDADRIPLLPWELEEVHSMYLALRGFLDAAKINAFHPGHGSCEKTLVWKEGNVWCRCRLDWDPKDQLIWDDLKSTEGSANPPTWAARVMCQIGADIQAAWYRRGIKAVYKVANPRFRFIVAESSEPYCCGVVEPSPRALELANLEIDRALQIWDRCLTDNVWPGYKLDTYLADPPIWREAAYMNREITEGT